MTESWRTELRTWAHDCAADFQSRPGILGVAIGGSLARGQEWRHSDLELGVLVEERDPTLPYFNIFRGRGVEAIQLVRRNLEEQLRQAEQGDLSPIVSWPIQLWAGRVVSDPTGILGRFKQQFDASLFRPEVVESKIAASQKKIEQFLDAARTLLAEDKPRAGLARGRLAMNEAILAVHWAYSTLPRSQNRTDSRLRQLCRKHSIMPFYALYRDVFALADTARAIQTYWPKAKAPVLEITRLWGGDSARDFFIFAVDSDFAWRQNAGILTVYRLLIPILGAPEKGILAKLDEPAWASQNQDMLRFLGLAHADRDTVARLIDRIADGCRYFTRTASG